MSTEPDSYQQDNYRPMESSDEAGELLACCEKTIAQHAAYNPMMVCPDCKQIIKCFTEERPFRNYMTFCRSRHRQVSNGRSSGFYVVVFRSYETFR